MYTPVKLTPVVLEFIKNNPGCKGRAIFQHVSKTYTAYPFVQRDITNTLTYMRRNLELIETDGKRGMGAGWYLNGEAPEKTEKLEVPPNLQYEIDMISIHVASANANIIEAMRLLKNLKSKVN